MSFGRNFIWPLLVVLFASCGNMMDDLNPSGTDRRPPVQSGTTGPSVGQNAPDFTLPDTIGTSVTLSSELTATSKRGIVLYFTMWCPVCDSHMSQMLNATIPYYPDIRFFAVDYVSGTVQDARNAEISAGYAGSAFTVLADTQLHVLNLYQATMGTTVVIDKGGIIRLNEDYKDSAKLHAVLSSLP